MMTSTPCNKTAQQPVMTKAALKFVRVLLLAVAGSAPAQSGSSEETYQIAKDAYVYACPLVLTNVTLRQHSTSPNRSDRATAGIASLSPHEDCGHPG